MMSLRIIALQLTVLLIVTACAGINPMGEGAARVDQVVSPLTSPLAQPTPIAPRPELPEPAEGKAALAGRLLVDYGDGYVPLELTVMWLAPAIYSDEGEPVFLSLDRANDPSTSTDLQGYFSLTDLEPGLYGLVVMHGIQLFLLEVVDSGERLVFELEPDEVLDLQDVRTLLPRL